VGPGEEHYLIPVGIEPKFRFCLARSLDIVAVNRDVDLWFNKISDFVDNHNNSVCKTAKTQTKMVFIKVLSCFDQNGHRQEFLP
jgi:hypothetical protein